MTRISNKRQRIKEAKTAPPFVSFILYPLSLIFYLSVFLYPSPANAVSPFNIWEGTNCNVPDAPPCGICEGAVVAVNALDVLWKFAAIITAGMIIAGGVFLMFTGANPAMKSRAQTWMKDAVIGFIICLSAFAIINTLMQFLLKSPEPSPWNEIKCVEPA